MKRTIIFLVCAGVVMLILISSYFYWKIEFAKSFVNTPYSKKISELALIESDYPFNTLENAITNLSESEASWQIRNSEDNNIRLSRQFISDSNKRIWFYVELFSKESFRSWCDSTGYENSITRTGNYQSMIRVYAIKNPKFTQDEIETYFDSLSFELHEQLNKINSGVGD